MSKPAWITNEEADKIVLSALRFVLVMLEENTPKEDYVKFLTMSIIKDIDDMYNVQRK